MFSRVEEKATAEGACPRDGESVPPPLAAGSLDSLVQKIKVERERER